VTATDVAKTSRWCAPGFRTPGGRTAIVHGTLCAVPGGSLNFDLQNAGRQTAIDSGCNLLLSRSGT